jgi:hypothetical protein
MAQPLSLAALLPERLDGLAEQARGAMCQDEQIDRLSLAWDYVGSQLEDSLKSALDCDLLELAAKGWATSKSLAEFSDPEKHPPGERSVVELGEHEWSKDVYPVISVTIASCPCVDLKFTFTVTGHFGGIKLAIADAHIIGGSLGDAWVSGQLSYGDVPLHQAADSRRLPLSGEFELKAPGIALPRLH